MLGLTNPVLADVDKSFLLQFSALVIATVAVIFLIGQFGAVLLNRALRYVATPQFNDFYGQVIEPRRTLLGSVIALGLFDIVLWLFFKVFLDVPWYTSLEKFFTLGLTVAFGWLMSRLFKEYFDSYILGAAAKQGQKTNSELLVLGKFFANFGIIVVLTIIFGQTHNFNIFGLVASLGVGGIAIAFAAQKVLEQLLGGVVIYIDRPFNIDDYIGLPDGTYGRVESLGLRSTKVRTSGKGTLAIVPNNAIISLHLTISCWIVCCSSTSRYSMI